MMGGISNVLQPARRFTATYHNRLQFFFYEGANFILFLYENAKSFQAAGWGGIFQQSPTALSAVFFALGSTLIWLFNPKQRPEFLMYGGFALTAGGACLLWAGFPLTGCSVMLASLETARGGLALVRPEQKLAYYLSYCAGLQFYQSGFNWVSSKSRFVEHYFNRRPFITGALIKAPLRLEMVWRGNAVAAFVGICWALGDLMLALNDRDFSTWVRGDSGRGR